MKLRAILPAAALALPAAYALPLTNNSHSVVVLPHSKPDGDAMLRAEKRGSVSAGIKIIPAPLDDDGERLDVILARDTIESQDDSIAPRAPVRNWWSSAQFWKTDAYEKLDGSQELANTEKLRDFQGYSKFLQTEIDKANEDIKSHPYSSLEYVAADVARRYLPRRKEIIDRTAAELLAGEHDSSLLLKHESQNALKLKEFKATSADHQREIDRAVKEREAARHLSPEFELAEEKIKFHSSEKKRIDHRVIAYAAEEEERNRELLAQVEARKGKGKRREHV